MPVPDRIARLSVIAAKPARRIVGLMSGTSLDGLDIGLCTIHGAGDTTRCELERFVTRPYTIEEKTRLRTIVYRDQGGLRDAAIVNAWLADVHATYVLAALAEWGVAPGAVDAIASHGQTVYHAPRSWKSEVRADGPRADALPQHHATLQLGDGDQLAVRTGIVTVSDFRQKEIAGGGQGAPLAPYTDALLYRADTPRILLNLGGIANFTYLPARGSDRPPRFGDTGPANTLIDAEARSLDRHGPGHDVDGAGAAKGQVNAALLAEFKSHPYFALRCPKSTGPEMFGQKYVDSALVSLPRGGGRKLGKYDLLATLTRLTAETVTDAIKREVPDWPETALYVTGGGQHNKTLLRWIGEGLRGVPIRDSGELGVPGDAKEALLFAVLANECLAGPGFLAADGSGRRIAFGKISLPD